MGQLVNKSWTPTDITKAYLLLLLSR